MKLNDTLKLQWQMFLNKLGIGKAIKSDWINKSILERAKTEKVVICPLSGYPSDEEYSEGMQETKEGTNIYIGTRVCSEVKKVLKTGIGVLCYKCDSFTIVDKKVFDKVDTSEYYESELENGDVIDCFQCPHCSDKYRFAPTQEELHAKSVVDSRVNKHIS